MANDMWTQLMNVQRVVDGQNFSLQTHPNGSLDPPKNESLLIYSINPGMPVGHVSVIVDVQPGFVRVAEQNFDSYYWSGNYARQIPVIFENGSYYIEDGYTIYGWMSVEDNNQQLQPLNQSTINAIIKLNQSASNFVSSQSAINHYTSLPFFLCFALLHYAFY